MSNKKYIKKTYRMLWVFFYMLPLIAMVLFNFGGYISDRADMSIISGVDIFDQLFNFPQIQIVNTVLDSISSYAGMDFLAQGSFFNYFVSYMIAVTLCRILVDLLLLLPRIGIKFMNKLSDEE